MPLKYTCKLSIPLLAFAQLILCQSNDTTPAQLDEMLTRVTQNDYNPGTIAMIERTGDQRAIPILRDAFAKASDGLNKAAIARGLVRLGVQDEVYWAVLSQRAKQAVSSKAPAVFPDTPPAGGYVSGSYSAAFVAWAKANRLDPDKAAYDQMYTVPARRPNDGRYGRPKRDSLTATGTVLPKLRGETRRSGRIGIDSG